ncbi:MAG: translocation/assembly module TamB domain-containing protein [Hahellaceae bacterium]|nr:translocation/assembly module TamB domain-containing protein [Hahellaceae bacterium]MCP5212712.1 translocation/assembly module TamB domain-containing protein [Hahellaceae bacterium]
MIHLTRRILRWTILSFLALSLVLVLWALTSESAPRLLGRYLSALLPPMQLEIRRGTLLTGVYVDYFRWKTDAVDIEAENTSIEWSFSCFLSASLCIEKTRFGLLQLVFHRVDDNGEEEVSSGLPQVPAPFSMYIDDGEIDTLRFVLPGSIEEVRKIKLKANWVDDTLSIEQIAGRYRGIDFITSGPFSMVDKWSLALDGSVQLGQKTLADLGLDAVFKNTLNIPFQLSGQGLAYVLDLSLNQQFPGNFSGFIDFSDESMPVTLSMQSTSVWRVPASLAEQFLAGDAFAENGRFPAESFRLDEINLQTNGSLRDMSLQAQASLKTPLWPIEKIDFSAGLKDNQHVWLDKLRIHTTKGELTGDAQIALLPRPFGQINLRVAEMDFIDTPIKQPLNVSSLVRLTAEMEESSLDLRLALKDTVLLYDGHDLRGEVVVLAGSDTRTNRWDFSADTVLTLAGLPTLRAGADVALDGNSLDFSVLEFAFVNGVNGLSAKKKNSAKTGGKHISSGGMGVVSGSGKLQISEIPQWDFQFAMREVLLPASLMAMVPSDVVDFAAGAINGGIKVKGNEASSKLIVSNLKTPVRIHGLQKSEDLPLALNGTFHLQPAESLNIESASLDFGASRLSANGGVFWGSVPSSKFPPLTFEFSRLDLSRWIEDATGVINGRGSLNGHVSSADLVANIVAEGLSYQDYSSAKTVMNIDARKHGVQGITGSLKAEQLQIGEKAIASVSLGITGDKSAHTVRSSVLINTDASVQLDCQGGSVGAIWSGACANFVVRHREAQWRLLQSIGYKVNVESPSADIAPFCLAQATTSMQPDSPARVCLNESFSFTKDAYRGEVGLQSFPANWFARYWPELPALQGIFDTRLSFLGRENRPFEAVMQVDSSEIGIIDLVQRNSGKDNPFIIKNISASSKVKGDKADVNGRFGIGKEGEFGLRLSLSDLKNSKKMSGKINLNDFDLAMLAGVLPDIDTIEGSLGASLNVAGTLTDPKISGQWALENAVLDTLQLPEPISKINIAGKLNDTNMHFNGGFATAAGGANLEGLLDWAGPWYLESRLQSEQITVAPIHGVKLHVRPDIEVKVREGLLFVGGKVDVPHGSIEIIELPPDAKSTSSDFVIVAEGKAVESKWKVTTDLSVNLGKDVQFKGLGVQTYIDGGIKIKQRQNVMFADGQLASREGSFSFLGQKLEIREGRLIFNGALEDPDIYIEAVRNIEDEKVVAGIRLTGKASEPKLEVFSDPTMEETAALHYVMTGRKPAPGSTYGAGLAGNLLLGRMGANNGWFTENVVGKLGVTDFQISTQAENEGTSVQVSGYLSPDLYLQYGVKLFDEVNTLSLRYRLHSDLFLEAMTGLDSSLDLIYSFEIK